MKLREIFEDVTGPGVVAAPFLKDGPLKVAKHFVDRLRERELDLKTVSRFISRAIKKNKAEIEALPVDTSFVLKSKFGLGVAVVKQETPRGIVYLINTAHPQFSVGPNQEVFLGDSRFTENESITEGIQTFHSSGVSTISKFNSFSHFGTEAAAIDRIKNLVKQKRANPDSVITIYNVDLNIKKPLMIKDNPKANHSSDIYAVALRDAKIIDQDTMMRIRMNNPFEFADLDDDPDDLAKLWPRYEKNNLATIKKILKSKGYDGLVYKNEGEDKGSLAYVILDPNQARITGKKQVAITDLIKGKQTPKNPNTVVKKVANPNSVVKEESKLLNKKTPTVGELAEKYKTSLLAVELQLKKGIKVEMEHTKKHRVAKEIALDHLAEDLYYYDKLGKIEGKKNGNKR